MTIVSIGETPPRNNCQTQPDLIVPKEPAEDLQDQLKTLADLDTSALKKLWQRCHKQALPPALNRDLMIRMTAYKLQEKALGGLTGAVKRKLKLLSQRAEAGGTGGTATPINLKPGTKLVRSWHDKTYTVSVVDDGFEYDGQRYSSLSQIACTITGAHWSGPRFFGLKPKHKLPPRSKRVEPDAQDSTTKGTDV